MSAVVLNQRNEISIDDSINIYDDSLMSIVYNFHSKNNSIEIVNRLKNFLENDGENLSLNDYRLIRGLIGEDNSMYNKLVSNAISKGYNKEEAARISMLFNDYLTDQHYILLSIAPQSRNKPQGGRGRIKTLSNNALHVDVKKDLQNKIQDRQKAENAFYDFERAVFNPLNKTPIKSQFEEMGVYAQNFDSSRMSKYKTHTLELALSKINKEDNTETKEKKSIFEKVLSKIKDYVSNR